MSSENDEKNSAEVTQPAISDAMADAALSVIARGVACKPGCSYEQHRRDEMRAALQSAYPAIRRQVAEQIAVAIERSEDDARRAEQQAQLDGARGTAATWFNIATGYMRSAEIAREIGAGTASARTGTPATTDLPPAPQALSKRLPGATA